MFRLRRYDHVTDALATLYWLSLPERVDFNPLKGSGGRWLHFEVFSAIQV